MHTGLFVSHKAPNHMIGRFPGTTISEAEECGVCRL